MATCPVCHLPVHLAGETIHRCCSFARARGEDDCGGCRGFKQRVREGLA
jgi:hypothetical protein